MEGQPPPNLGTIAAIARRYAARGRDSRPRTRPRGWTKLAALRACGAPGGSQSLPAVRSWIHESVLRTAFWLRLLSVPALSLRTNAQQTDAV